ncbi:DUF4129 domain-containing protein [Rossellomorea aquimaris]|uniref:DUF4129 domain-containing protein n=1 Tax=Rossellomorea aquimaris TaxID=189382 RepID=UPI000AB78DB6
MFKEDVARDKMQDILNGSEYKAYASENVLTKLWENAKEWLAEKLANLFPSLVPTSEVASSLFIIIIIVVVLVLLVTLTLSIRNGLRRRKFRYNKPLQTMNEMQWSFESHLAEAKRQEELEEYSLATRHMFLALLLFFHEKEWLEARVWKTNWDYYEELRRVHEGKADRFYHLAILFDEVAYGERFILKEEYEKYRNEAKSWMDREREASA